MNSREEEDKRRQGEGGPLPQRRSRTFFKGDGWYFMTRERVDVGPFASQELAEIGVQDYAGFSTDESAGLSRIRWTLCRTKVRVEH